jgi:Uma2 family endonuclease
MKTTDSQRFLLDPAQLDGNPDAPLFIPGVSEEEYYALDGIRGYQYLRGDLIKEPVSIVHEGLNGFLYVLLRGFAEERGGDALVTSAGYPMRLDPQWSPEPDLMVIRAERRHLVSRQRLDGPADLVVEIASYSHPGIDLRLKLPRYRQARVPEMWFVNPFVKAVQAEVLRRGGEPGTSDSNGEAGAYETRTLSAGRLTTAALPGFWIEVAWLWQEPLPSAQACLRQILA